MLVRLKHLRESGKEQCKKSLFVIPYILTFSNAIFGFLSILKALEHDYTTAAVYIVMAAFLDGFDGRLARAIGSSSCFGMELDSLCDAISFCLAPTILLYSWFSDYIAGLGTLVLAFYLCAGLTRLAKFNSTDQKTHFEFIGLPTTIAAFFIATLILYSNWMLCHSWKLLLYKQVLFPIVGIIALLMISPFKFY